MNFVAHRKIALLLFGVLSAGLGAEILVRVCGAAPQVAVTRMTRFRLSSNRSIVYEPVEGNDFGVDFSNRLGYRGPEYPKARSPGMGRIAVLGDSISEGMRINDYQAVYSNILQQRMHDAGNRLEVLNFGVAGYDTQQEVETFKDKAAGFTPDLVILQYALNDSYQDDGNLAEDLVNSLTGRDTIEQASDSSLFLSSALYRFLRYRVLRSAPLDRWRKAASKRDEAGQQRVRDAFGELGRSAGRACVLVAIFPWFDPGLNPYPYLKIHADISSLAASHGFWVADLLPAFQACERRSNAPLHYDHVHPNELGHRCAGEALAAFITKRDLLRQCLAGGLEGAAM